MYVFLSSVFSGLPRNICRSFRLPPKEEGRVQWDFEHKPYLLSLPAAQLLCARQSLCVG